MEQAKDLPDAKRAAPERAPVEEERVARSRCPFCREDVLSTQAVAACEACLSRHHGACWSESGSCASCGHRSALTREAPRPRRASSLWALAVLALGVLGGHAVTRLTTQAEGEGQLSGTVEGQLSGTVETRLAEPEQGQATRAQPGQLLVRLGVVVDDALTITAIHAGTPLDGKVFTGLRIESIDGAAVTNRAELEARLDRPLTGVPVTLGLRHTRDGQVTDRTELVKVELGPR